MGAEVELRGVDRKYGPITALDTTSTILTAGSFTSLVGPSGCGKSTMLDIIGGLNSGYGGEVFIDGGLVRKPRKETGIIFQDAALLPWRTVLDNAAFALEAQKVSKDRRRAIASDILKRVGLSEFSKRYPHELSGGMRQRTAIARVLSTEPDLILADEPFGALDEQTRMILGLELLRMVRQTDATILFVTHSIQEAVLLSDRVLAMSARPGKVILDTKVDLPEDREPGIMGSADAARLVEEIWGVLRVEAEHAMSRQAKAL